MSLRDRIHGNELDLSLNQLTEVPVRELAAASKATHLDLSCNRIETLPTTFATLTHLVKIDLSGNLLTELPHNFGNLLNLEYLDLYGNLLGSLPVSFSRLKNLRWLDLKNNPLESTLKAVAGDCLDEKQCQLCAKKVVALMQSIDSEMERKKQKKLKEMREKEAIQRAKMEKELEEQRRQKKLGKERRKAESRLRREDKSDQKGNENSDEKISDIKTIENEDTNRNEVKRSLLLKMLAFVFLGAVTLFFLFELHFVSFDDISVPNIENIISELITKIYKIILKCSSNSAPYIMNVKSAVLKAVHYAMLYVSDFVSNIEMFLSIYF